jgi:dTDP-4-dehydrorhamnose reductase
MPTTSSSALGNPLLIGYSGQLGTAIGAELTAASKVGRSDLDLAQISIEQARNFLRKLRPTSIINCAGYTQVDRAEDEEDLATSINGTAVGILAKVAGDADIPFVTFSTDYVFDGEATEPYLESDEARPVSAYGRSKLAGERLAVAANPNSLVIRTSWLLSGTHPNFVATMLRLADEGRPFRVVNDQHGRPTIARDLARASLTALGTGVTGLLHLANPGATTWFDLAQAAIGHARLDISLVTPCQTADYPTPAARPAFSVLDTSRASQLGLMMPEWRDSLPALVTEIMSQGSPLLG